ncbi:MAG: SCO family protein [Motiliproteus sp.]
MAKKLNQLERIALITLVLLVALSAGLYLSQLLTNNPSAELATRQLGGDFTLNSLNGPVSLSDYKGQGVIVMFGYTYCPDICPTGLANLGAALNRLSEAEQQQLQPMFISVDPDRDTPDRLDQYSRYFHPSLLGLTASKPEIDPVVKAYGAFYRKVDMPNSAMKYSVDHSARIYLIDRNGQMIEALHHNTPTAELATALQKLLLQS